MEKIVCQLCQKKYRRITNTHLFRKHQITMKEYQALFPETPIDAPGLAMQRVDHLRHKTYQEVYGEKKAGELINVRKQDALKQMKNPSQIDVRKAKCGYIYTDEQKKHLSDTKTIHGSNTYRKRGLEYYGLECQRCGFESEKESDFIVHHKDFLNINSELGNHSIENLQVLCRSCHGKLHNELSEIGGNFVGIPNVEKGIHYILKGLQQEFGLNLSDENFKDTPKRIARAYREIFSGLKNTDQKIDEILATSFPSEGYESMIFCPDIIAYSMCPHHLLPVEYKVTVAYIPSLKGRVLGASKISRIIDVLSQRPVLQEKFTIDLIHTLEKIKPIGIAVVVSGIHYCMRMRGIKKQTSFETSSMAGVFMEDASARKEFFDLLQLSKRTN
jgi:GTP cyclohydrolase I